MDMISGMDLQKQSNRSVIAQINRFMATPQYVALAAALTLVCNVFSLELPVYTVIAAIFVYVSLFGNDLLPIAPFFAFGYISVSGSNNPGQFQDSVFSAQNGGIYIGCLGALMALAILYRVIHDRKVFFSKRCALLPGLLALGGAYLLSGLGSAAYPAALGKNLLFAGLQCCAVILPYWLLSCSVEWNKARRDYLAWIGFSAGGILLCQILNIYLSNGVIVDGVIHRPHIYTGWGMYNNLGGMLAMMIPFAFYLAAKYHKGWIGTVIGSAFLIGVLMTCSRSSILTGTCAYIAGILLMLHYARNRRHNFIALVTTICVVVAVLVLFYKPLLRLFSDLLQMGMDPSSRDMIYEEGLKLFAQAPVFGNSFFSPGFTPWDWSEVESFSGFFPPRWHNTIVQLLASCGSAGIAAYLFHRFQTVHLFFKKPCKETMFIACSICALLICSLFDCHLFNIGPALFYSAALAFVENCFNHYDFVARPNPLKKI